MAVVLGTDGYRYEVQDNWAKLPPGMEFNADVAAVGVDKHDNVYAFNRGKHPMCVFDRDGNLLRTWGEGVFPAAARRLHGARRHDLADRRRRPHGSPVHARRQGAADHRHPRQAGALYERRAVPPLHPHRAVAGRRLPLRLGRLRQLPRPQIHARRQVADRRGASPAPIPASSTSRTTSAATRTAGSMSPTARTTASRCSTATASTRRSGTTCTAPPGCAWRTGTRTPRFYIGEIGPDMAVNIDLPNCGPRVSIYTHKGELLARLGHEHAGLATGQFISPHGLAVDSRGDIYVGEVCYTNWGRRVRAKGEQIPPGLRSLQKLVKVGR